MKKPFNNHLSENIVVKNVISDIQSGSWKENEVISYEFQGSMKYASYYVNTTADYILVVTVDVDELLSPISTINTKGTIGLLLAFTICTLIIGVLITFIVVSPIMKIAKACKVQRRIFRDGLAVSVHGLKFDVTRCRVNSVNSCIHFVFIRNVPADLG